MTRRPKLVCLALLLVLALSGCWSAQSTVGVKAFYVGRDSSLSVVEGQSIVEGGNVVDGSIGASIMVSALNSSIPLSVVEGGAVEYTGSASTTLSALSDSPLSVVEGQISATKTPTPSTSPDPLRLAFPDPPASPVSAWRPPLYPTPWALAPYDHFFFARPIAANEINWPLADYRYGGVFFERAVHTGIDIPVPTDTPVLAAGPGKVIWAGYGLYSLIPGDAQDPYGLAIAIRHDFGYEGENLYTVYGHLDRIDVARGQHVQTGDPLGLSGETGRTTGPHLHFEVRIGKNNFFGSRNPELWLAPPQGWGLLAARVMTTAGELLPGQKIDVQSKDSGQRWTVKTYGEGSANSDPYYRENLVLGDLPAGEYTVLIPYAGSLYNWDIAIRPGMVTYFTFRGKLGYKNDLPSDPWAVFNPDTWGRPTSP